MKSIRRLYFYLVAFISIEIVLWGLVGLLRSIMDETVSGGADTLAPVSYTHLTLPTTPYV